MSPHAASARKRLRLLCTGLVIAAAAGAARAEPPDAPGLECQVLRQRADGAITLEVRFANGTDRDLALGPGPHLVWYRDAAATDAMEHTARVSPMPDVPLVVPAGGARVVLFALHAPQAQGLRCNPRLPAQAGLYFYQFNPRPRLRCLLQGYDLAALPPDPAGCRRPVDPRAPG